MRKNYEVGMTARRTRRFTADDVQAFAGVTGDANPVHLDDDYAAATSFGQRIVHGMLTASLISAIIGNDLPGEGAIYMRQDLQFKAPVYLGDTITATVEITHIREKRGIITLATTCTNQGQTPVLTGEAVVMVPDA